MVMFDLQKKRERISTIVPIQLLEDDISMGIWLWVKTLGPQVP